MKTINLLQLLIDETIYIKMQLPKLKTLLTEQVTPQENQAFLKFLKAKQEREKHPDAKRQLEPLVRNIERGQPNFDILKKDPGFEQLVSDIEPDAPRMGVFSPQELQDLSKYRDKYFAWYGGSIFKPEGRENTNLKRVWNRVWKGRQG